MDDKKGTFLHTLLFRCQECNQPLIALVMSTDRNIEGIDGNSLDLLCKCGWSKHSLGAGALRHWVTPWLNETGGDPKSISQRHGDDSITAA
jgi:hypothetical protein